MFYWSHNDAIWGKNAGAESAQWCKIPKLFKNWNLQKLEFPALSFGQTLKKMKKKMFYEFSVGKLILHHCAVSKEELSALCTVMQKAKKTQNIRKFQSSKVPNFPGNFLVHNLGF